MTSDASADERYAALAARIAALEERASDAEVASAGTAAPDAPTAPAAPASDLPDPDTFWVLSGLKRREPGADGAVIYAGVVPTAAGEINWQYQHSAAELIESDDDEHVAQRLAALGSAVRLRVLRAVLAGTDGIADLTALDDMGTKGQLYHHVRALTAAGWLRSAGRGRVQVPAERVVPLVLALAATR